MKISVITVCLNSEKYLRNCLDSIRSQTYQNIELIVIDGKSKDRTSEIINDNLDIISHFISEPDRGIYDAINKGIKAATGDIIGTLNSDDMFASPSSIELIVNCFKKQNVDAVYGDLVYINPEKGDKIHRIWKGKTFRRGLFKYGWMPAHPTFYVKHNLIKLYGLYKNHYYTAADYEFMARYLYKFKCSAAYLSRVLIKMRVGGISNKSLRGRLRANRRDYLAMKENKIPFSFIVSILKPLIKLHQFKQLPPGIKPYSFKKIKPLKPALSGSEVDNDVNVHPGKKLIQLTPLQTNFLRNLV